MKKKVRAALRGEDGLEFLRPGKPVGVGTGDVGPVAVHALHEYECLCSPACGVEFSG